MVSLVELVSLRGLRRIDFEAVATKGSRVSSYVWFWGLVCRQLRLTYKICSMFMATEFCRSWASTGLAGKANSYFPTYG